MTIEQVFEVLGSGGAIASILGSAYAVGLAVEKNVSDTARADFRAYLVSGRAYSDTLQLPKGIRASFERIFGERHLSWKCVLRSTAVSTFSILVLFLISGFHNPTLFPGLASIFTGHDGGFLTGDNFIWVKIMRYYLAAWLFWSVPFDYAMLWKTRILLRLFEKRTSYWSGLYALLLAADIAMSYVAFGFGSGLVTIVLSGDLSRALSAAVTGAFSVDFFWNLFTDTTDIAVTIRALFFASILPSLWFWLWVGATLLGTMTGRLRPIFRFAGYALPVTEKPFVTTSITAGVMGCVIYALARLVFG